MADLTIGNTLRPTLVCGTLLGLSLGLISHLFTGDVLAVSGALLIQIAYGAWIVWIATIMIPDGMNVLGAIADDPGRSAELRPSLMRLIRCTNPLFQGVPTCWIGATTPNWFWSAAILVLFQILLYRAWSGKEFSVRGWAVLLAYSVVGVISGVFLNMVI